MLVLKRYGSMPFGTFGELILPNSEMRFYTVERPWLDNKPRLSCIPLGNYKLLWLPTSTPVPKQFHCHTWYLYGDTVGIRGDGKHRQNCAVHIGNIHTDVTGCLAIGHKLGIVKGKLGVIASRSALEALYDICGPKDLELAIISSLMG